MTLAFDSSFDSHRYDFRFLRYPASKGSLIFNSTFFLVALSFSFSLTRPPWSIPIMHTMCGGQLQSPFPPLLPRYIVRISEKRCRSQRFGYAFIHASRAPFHIFSNQISQNQLRYWFETKNKSIKSLFSSVHKVYANFKNLFQDYYSTLWYINVYIYYDNI